MRPISACLGSTGTISAIPLIIDIDFAFFDCTGLRAQDWLVFPVARPAQVCARSSLNTITQPADHTHPRAVYRNGGHLASSASAAEGGRSLDVASNTDPLSS